MDRSWIHGRRFTPAYMDGVEQFMEFIRGQFPGDSEIHCPCRRCLNKTLRPQHEVNDHIHIFGMSRLYTRWVHHGESPDGQVAEFREAEVQHDEYDDSDLIYQEDCCSHTVQQGEGDGEVHQGDGEVHQGDGEDEVEVNNQDGEYTRIDGRLHDLIRNKKLANISVDADEEEDEDEEEEEDDTMMKYFSDNGDEEAEDEDEEVDEDDP